MYRTATEHSAPSSEHSAGAAGARLGGERANRILARYQLMVELLVANYMANGFPPFTQPLTPFEQYQRLLAMRGAGNPRFWQDPEAQAAFARLEQQFGAAPPLARW